MGVPLFAGSVNRQPSPKILSDWFQFYNEQRPHTAFDGRRPMEVYGGLELNNVANLSNQTGPPHTSKTGELLLKVTRQFCVFCRAKSERHGGFLRPYMLLQTLPGKSLPQTIDKNFAGP